MNILYLLEVFPRANSETFVLNEINELIQSGNNVYIIANRKDDIGHEQLLKFGVLNNVLYTGLQKNSLVNLFLMIRVIFLELFINPLWLIKILPYIINTHTNFKNMGFSFMVMRKVKMLNFDHVHVPFSHLSFLSAAKFISIFNKVPFTIVFRAVDLYERVINRNSKQKIDIAKKTNKVITISNYNKMHLIERGVPEENIEIIHSATNLEDFSPSNKCSEVKIITVARFCEKKGIEYLLKSYKDLKDRKITFKGLIIGDGPLHDKYKKLIEEYKLKDEVSIKSTMTHGSIKKELQKSMIFVLPCVIADDGDRDILPNVVKEAMAMELPVITSNVAGIEELITNNTDGLLVKDKNSDELTQAIIKLIKDKELRSILGKNGRKKIDAEFNIKNEALKLNDIILSLKK